MVRVGDGKGNSAATFCDSRWFAWSLAASLWLKWCHRHHPCDTISIRLHHWSDLIHCEDAPCYIANTLRVLVHPSVAAVLGSSRSIGAARIKPLDRYEPATRFRDPCKPLPSASVEGGCWTDSRIHAQDSRDAVSLLLRTESISILQPRGVHHQLTYMKLSRTSSTGREHAG